MPRFEVHHNRSFPRGRARRAALRKVRAAMAAVARWFVRSWLEVFPPPTPTNGAPPLKRRAGALAEGALLSENLDLVSKHRVR